MCSELVTIAILSSQHRYSEYFSALDTQENSDNNHTQWNIVETLDIDSEYFQI